MNLEKVKYIHNITFGDSTFMKELCCGTTKLGNLFPSDKSLFAV